MELIIDAIVEQLTIMQDLPRDEGGFLDEIDLADEVWWGNPGVLAEQQYPAIYVEPVISSPESETTGNMTRTETIRIVLLADPRVYYDETEISEGTASREMVRTMEAIEKWFQKTSLRQPNGLAPYTSRLVVGQTEYAPQFRGSLISLGATVVLLVDSKLPRVN